MAQKQITALTEAPDVQIADLLLLRDDSVAEDRKVTYETLLNDILSRQKIRTVGASGAMHSDLQSAHDAASSGERILIVSDLEIDTKVTISKPDLMIEMRPGYAIKKAAGAAATNFTGIEITDVAHRTKMKHVKIGDSSNPFSGSGDIAIDLHVDAENCLFFNMMYDDANDTNLKDNSNLTYQNSLEEIHT